MVKFNFLFNFSSSYTGGGLNRLKAYLHFYNSIGGANFIVNDQLKGELNEGINNIFYIKTNKIKRLFNDEYYMKSILKNVGNIDLYFAYGIPVYSRVGKYNWFHVSNLLSILPQKKMMSISRYLQMKILQRRIRKSQKIIDFFSAESNYSLDKGRELIGNKDSISFKLLKNGISEALINRSPTYKEPRSAITVGVQKYKNIENVYKVFEKLRGDGVLDHLTIIGCRSKVSGHISNNSAVQIIEKLPHYELMNLLAKKEYYISLSEIENSSIAVIEGLTLCKNSILSNIPPHIESIQDFGFKVKKIDSISFDIILCNGEACIESLIKNTWSHLINEFHKNLITDMVNL